MHGCACVCVRARHNWENQSLSGEVTQGPAGLCIPLAFSGYFSGSETTVSNTNHNSTVKELSEEYLLSTSCLSDTGGSLNPLHMRVSTDNLLIPRMGKLRLGR